MHIYSCQIINCWVYTIFDWTCLVCCFVQQCMFWLNINMFNPFFYKAVYLRFIIVILIYMHFSKSVKEVQDRCNVFGSTKYNVYGSMGVSFMLVSVSKYIHLFTPTKYSTTSFLYSKDQIHIRFLLFTTYTTTVTSLSLFLICGVVCLYPWFCESVWTRGSLFWLILTSHIVSWNY